MKLTITSENDLNKQDLESASGVYEFLFLLNKTPVFKRNDVSYRYPTGNDINLVSYSLTYLDGQWRVRRNNSPNKNDWTNAKIVFRRKTDCKYFFVLWTADFLRSKYIRNKWEVGRV